MEPEPIFLLVGAESRSQIFKAAPAVRYILEKAKKKSLVLELGRYRTYELSSIYKDKYDPKHNVTI